MFETGNPFSLAMVRISSLPDLSRFVKRQDKLPVYNTVHLLVGEDTIEVSSSIILFIYNCKALALILVFILNLNVLKIGLIYSAF